MNNPHDVLGVAQGASEDEIKAAYRRLAKQFHPDLNRDDPAAEARFKEVSAAYEALTKPQANQQQQQRHHHQGFHFEFNEGAQQQMFEEMIRRMREQEIRQQNSDLQTQVSISLEDSFNGCDIDIHITQMEGSPKHRVSIPKGAAHGQRLRVPGAGLHRNKNYPAGDLYVVVTIAPHERLMRLGDDLLVRLEINCLEAIVGKTLTVTGIDGTEIEVAIPAGCQFGQRVRVGEHGMPIWGTDARGSLVAEVVVTVPTAITAEHKNLVNQITNLLPKEIEIR